jgi:hypothetical protein
MAAKTVRGKILEQGIQLTEGDRNASYGHPFPNLTAFAKYVDTYLRQLGWTGPPLDSVDGTMIMTFTKTSRVPANKNHKDNYLDGATYWAIAGENAQIESGELPFVRDEYKWDYETSPGAGNLVSNGVLTGVPEDVLRAMREDASRIPATKPSRHGAQPYDRPNAGTACEWAEYFDNTDPFSDYCYRCKECGFKITSCDPKERACPGPPAEKPEKKKRPYCEYTYKFDTRDLERPERWECGVCGSRIYLAKGDAPPLDFKCTGS